MAAAKYTLGANPHAVERTLFGNQSLDAAACTLGGTNTNRIRITNATDFRIGGRTFTKAATDNITWGTVPSAMAVQADLTTRFYTISLDSTGALNVTQGDAGATAALATIPDAAPGTAVIGIMKVVCAGGTFTPGTTNLTGAAGVTATFRDYSMLPIETYW